MTLALLLYTIGSLMDYATTAWFIEHGGREGNPVAVAIVNVFGMDGLLLGKILVVILVWLIVVYIRKEAPKITFYALYIATLGQWLVVAWNTFWVRVIMEVV